MRRILAEPGRGPGLAMSYVRLLREGQVARAPVRALHTKLSGPPVGFPDIFSLRGMLACGSYLRIHRRALAIARIPSHFVL